MERDWRAEERAWSRGPRRLGEVMESLCSSGSWGRGGGWGGIRTGHLSQDSWQAILWKELWVLATEKVETKVILTENEVEQTPLGWTAVGPSALSHAVTWPQCGGSSWNDSAPGLTRIPSIPSQGILVTWGVFTLTFKEDICHFFPSPLPALGFVVQRTNYGLLFFTSEHKISYWIEPLQALSLSAARIGLGLGLGFFLSPLPWYWPFLFKTCFCFLGFLKDPFHCTLDRFPYSIQYILLWCIEPECWYILWFLIFVYIFSAGW